MARLASITLSVSTCRLRHLARPANARRVDDAELLAVPLQERVDRVARGARHLRDDHPVLAQQPIDERRLARVRAADDRDRGFAGSFGGPAVTRPDRGSARAPGSRRSFEQIADAVAVLGADLHDRVEAEPVQLEGSVARATIVHLVDGEDDRHAGSTRGRGDVLVAGNQSFAAVDDHHDEVGRPATRVVRARRRGRAADPRWRRTIHRCRSASK